MEESIKMMAEMEDLKQLKRTAEVRAAALLL